LASFVAALASPAGAADEPGMRRVPLLLVAVISVLGVLAPAASAATGRKPLQPSSRARAESALDRVEQLRQGQGVRSGRELTPALAALAKRQGSLSSGDRERARSILARPTDGASDPFGDGYTVAEHAPFCTADFCIHFVTSTADAPSLTDSDSDGFPDYVETMAAQFEFVHSIENGTAAGDLGWASPKPDAGKGGSNLTDVYIKQLGNSGIFGYAAPEENSVSAYAYLVMDDDYSPAEFPGFAQPVDALDVTAAHEYNHVLQFTYDSIQDTWMLEATATWAENKVYPAVDDYLNYLGPWVGCSETPLTAADPPGTACDLKMYGSAVWNHWFDLRYGQDAIRQAWEVSDVSTPTSDFAPDAYGDVSQADGGAGFGDEFGRFAAAVAEWESPGSPFAGDSDHGSFPDVDRTGAPLTLGAAGRTVPLDHTSFVLVDVTPDASQPSLELHATAPPGLDSTLALVGRTGSDPHAGTVTTAVRRIAGGGAGTVTLANPGSYGRITAVLANADASQSGFSGSDWVWTKDAQPFQGVRVTGPGSAAAAAQPVAPAAPAAPAATPTPKLTSRFSLRPRQALKTILSRGVLVRVRCNQACRVRVDLRLSRSTARRLHLPSVIGVGVVKLSRSGVKSFRVHLSRRARKHVRGLRSLKLTARMRATRGSAKTPLRSLRVTVRR
jgi:hypothetical protein